MTSLYYSDQTYPVYGSEQFGPGNQGASDMINLSNWSRQPQATPLLPLPNSTCPNPVHTRTAKSLDEQSQMTTPYYGCCAQTTPLSCPSTRSSPVTNVKTESDGFDMQDANSAEAVLSDDQLVQMSVRDLNYMLQGSDRRVITAYKQKRRTLKNRGYALSCRVRRIQMQQHLEEENNALKRELARVKGQLTQMQHQLQYYQQQDMRQHHIQSRPLVPDVDPQQRFQAQYSVDQSPVSGSSSWSSSSDQSPVSSYDTFRDLF